MDTALVHVCETAIGLALLILSNLAIWPSLRVDRSRQDMFAVRDQLFDYAASEKIGFDHQAYRLLRQSMNGFIRYAHRLTFFQLLLTVLRWRALFETPELKWDENWRRSIRSIQDSGVQSCLEHFHARAMSLVLGRLISGSPILMLVALCLATLEFLRTGWKNFSQVCKYTENHAVSRFIDPRLLEEDAVKLAA